MPLQLFPCSLRQLELPHSSEALLQLLHSINDLLQAQSEADGRYSKNKTLTASLWTLKFQPVEGPLKRKTT
eukprot:766481-Hanusia_phi.AAC.3